ALGRDHDDHFRRRSVGRLGTLVSGVAVPLARGLSAPAWPVAVRAAVFLSGMPLLTELGAAIPCGAELTLMVGAAVSRAGRLLPSTEPAPVRAPLLRAFMLLPTIPRPAI